MNDNINYNKYIKYTVVFYTEFFFGVVSISKTIIIESEEDGNVNIKRNQMFQIVGAWPWNLSETKSLFAIVKTAGKVQLIDK